MERKTFLGSINLTKIDKSNLFKSQETGAIYLNIKILLQDEDDQYGNCAMITQVFDKDKRKNENGEYFKTPILGNLKKLKQKNDNPVVYDGTSSPDDLPF